jgi:hypothetical protein
MSIIQRRQINVSISEVKNMETIRPDNSLAFPFWVHALLCARSTSGNAWNGAGFQLP